MKVLSVERQTTRCRKALIAQFDYDHPVCQCDQSDVPCPLTNLSVNGEQASYNDVCVVLDMICE